LKVIVGTIGAMAVSWSEIATPHTIVRLVPVPSTWLHVSVVAPAAPVCVLVASSVIAAEAVRLPNNRTANDNAPAITLSADRRVLTRPFDMGKLLLESAADGYL
jgi:hypothetical protein